MKYLTPDTFEDVIKNHSLDYLKAEPFPHIVIDHFLKEDIAEEVLSEFNLEQKDSIYYHHFNERKQGFNEFDQMGSMTSQVISELNSQPFVDLLSQLTGIPDLVADKKMDGGGLHEMKPGGFLNVHVDFQSHTVQKTWSRKVNILIFLNKNWEDRYNGCLELWDRNVQNCVQKIKPVFNRCVIFNTSDISYHGVPDIIHCPEGQSRKSLALYYFKDEKKVCPIKSTHYQPRPTDSLAKRMGIYVDRSLVWGYSVFKRYVGVHDKKFSKILKSLNK